MLETNISYRILAVEKIAALLLLIYPTFLLTVDSGMNGVLVCMLLLAIATWVVLPTELGAVRWNREWTIYTIAMFSMTAATFISQSYLRHYTSSPYDATTRYWLALPVFLLLRRLRPKVFIALQFAYPIAAITGLLLARDIGGRVKIPTLDHIHFGNTELLLGFLSLLTINWFGQDSRPLYLLKILGFIAGVTASVYSGSRGGWLAIPVFIAISLYSRKRKISLTMVASTLVITILTTTALYSFTPHLRQRVNQMVYEVTTFNQGNRDTSIGIRWQLYDAAIDVIARNPLFGVGPNGFALEMRLMMEKGEISPVAAEAGKGEIHNDILSKFAGMGVFGLISMLAIYLVPFRLFWKAGKSPLAQIKHASLIGITFITGTFIFGLTVEFLNLNMFVTFYSFTVAVLLAICNNHHWECHAMTTRRTVTS